MAINLQQSLENDRVRLVPLQLTDLEDLYLTASDPDIWAQHPNKNRWQKEVFHGFFEGAIHSQGAYKIVDKPSKKIIGSTRYYNFNAAEDSIFIGYTFYATQHWGTGVNKSVKLLMLDYILQYVSTVYFHIGADNTRSQIAISRIGAEQIGEEEVAYVNEPSRRNFVYRITRSQWRKR